MTTASKNSLIEQINVNNKISTFINVKANVSYYFLLMSKEGITFQSIIHHQKMSVAAKQQKVGKNSEGTAAEIYANKDGDGWGVC